MRIIIYAMGQVFERCRENIKWDCIAAIADKKPQYTGMIHGVPIISPVDICNFQYDFIAIFSNKMFEEIKMELAGEYAIPKDRIISWREALKDGWKEGVGVSGFYKSFFKERKCRRILDAGMSVIPSFFLTKAELLDGEGVTLEGLLNSASVCNVNLYDKIYSKVCDCEDFYDAILLDETQYDEVQLDSFAERARYILLYTRYLNNGQANIESVKRKLQRYGNTRCISSVDGLFWILDTRGKKAQENLELSIYVVFHKKYHIRLDPPYQRLCVGGYLEPGVLTEQTGENISYLNKKINECTALYWIWKNTDTKYVGLNHYRRYFYNDKIKSMDNFLDSEHAEDILKNYDIILPKMGPMDGMTVIEQIHSSIDQSLFEKSYTIIRNAIEKKQPDYLDAFDSVMRGHNAFMCNMFVTKREILNAYCGWLFSFLIEAADEIDVEGYDSYSQRVIGFFAERMWTVWLRRNKLSIKELPFVVV